VSQKLELLQLLLLLSSLLVLLWWLLLKMLLLLLWRHCALCTRSWRNKGLKPCWCHPW
jgi:hypothetical protein